MTFSSITHSEKIEVDAKVSRWWDGRMLSGKSITKYILPGQLNVVLAFVTKWRACFLILESLWTSMLVLDH